jgi:hypothetical protein
MSNGWPPDDQGGRPPYVEYGAAGEPAPEWLDTGHGQPRYAPQGYDPGGYQQQDYGQAEHARAPGYDGDDYWLDHDVRPGEAGSRGVDYARAEYEQGGYAPDGYTGAGYQGNGYAQEEYADRGYARDAYESAGYARDEQIGYARDERAGYPAQDERAGYPPDEAAGYARDRYADAAFEQDYAQGGYAQADYAQAGYAQDDAGYAQDGYPGPAHAADTGYGSLDFGQPAAGPGTGDAPGYRPGARKPSSGHRSMRHSGGRGRSARRLAPPRGGSRFSGLRIGGLRVGGMGLALGGVAVLAAVVIAGIVVTRLSASSGPRHSLTVPAALGAFTRRTQLEQAMDINQLKSQVITMSSGQASQVVDAVYENGAATSGGAASGAASAGAGTPQIILLIGGKLSGASPAASVKSFTQRFKGAVVTSAGPLGGEAACVNAQADNPGSVAVCAWFDNDTFGEVASPTMKASALADEMRSIRPSVEHVVKG